VEKILVNNIKFYRKTNICNKKDLISIKERIDLEFAKNNIVWTHPLYQTQNDLEIRLKEHKSFINLKNKIFKIVKTIDKNLKFHSCWCNLSVEDNEYCFHKHKTKLTCVFYLQSKESCYGLRLKNPSLIFPAIENSVLIFDGSISHSIEYMPNKIFDNIDSHRYSIVFDFN